MIVIRKYFLESIHGVIVDVVDDLKTAMQRQAETGHFRDTPRRIFYIENNTKKYIKIEEARYVCWPIT